MAAYASALPAEPINTDNVKEVAPVAGIEDQEILEGAEARGGGGGHYYRDRYREYQRDRYHNYYPKRNRYRH